MPSSRQGYIKPEQVAELLTATPKRDDFLVIASAPLASMTAATQASCRALQHHRRGNLPGALNLTTREFGSPDKMWVVLPCSPLLDSWLTYGPPPAPESSTTTSPRVRTSPKSLSHFQPPRLSNPVRSQTRGPYVAHLLSHSPALPPSVEIVILEGGFQGWYRRFKGRRELFENMYGEVEDGVAGGTGDGREAAGPGWKAPKGEWEDVVNAKEGDVAEAEDSRKLRERLGRG
ncbi:SPOSA6832_04746, partial [Sporobolomyces salmonicolor]